MLRPDPPRDKDAPHTFSPASVLSAHYQSLEVISVALRVRAYRLTWVPREGLGSRGKGSRRMLSPALKVHFEPSEFLCRALCRNPLIPTSVGAAQLMSLRYMCRVGNWRETRMNTARPSHSDFFGVTPIRRGLRIRNDEVVGSIPTSSTNFNHLQSHPFGFVPLLSQFGFQFPKFRA